MFYFSFLCKASNSIINHKMQFWQAQRKGTNIFNQKINGELIETTKQYGIQFIRLAPDKFLSKQRDFLIGNADQYKGLIPEDLKALKGILDMCYQRRIPVVLTMLSLPRCRWKQHNHNRDDIRLWQDPHAQEQAAKFWQDLAGELKAHPAIVGYDILNEPYPEQVYGPQNSQGLEQRKKNKGHINSALQNFYKKVVAAIREVDLFTPIIIESSQRADADKFNFLEPLQDNYILYSFHFYEPYSYTNNRINKGRFRYPGSIPDDDDRATPRVWNKAKLKESLQPILNFQKKYHIPSHQIIVGEFGGHRSSKGLEDYFSDLIALFNEAGWHFAVYAFQEDTWDGMDYELGRQKLPWGYWKALEKGEEPKLIRSSETPVFKILMREWAK